jgi:hypothetical protein
MIERRFVFRGRWSERERYRLAWDKLVTRTRILGSVPVIVNGKWQIDADAVYSNHDVPTAELRLTFGVLAQLPVHVVEIVVDSKLKIRRRIKPKLSTNVVDPLFSLLLLQAPERYSGAQESLL